MPIATATVVLMAIVWQEYEDQSPTLTQAHHTHAPLLWQVTAAAGHRSQA